MDTAARRGPLRILAPLALIIFGLALVLIISGASGGSSGSGGSSAASAQKARDLGTGPKPAKRKSSSSSSSSGGQLPKSTYIVKTGDTLGSISQKVGVPVAKLQELNPNLDQFSLTTGQKIKIR